MERLTQEEKEKLQRILSELNDHQATAEALRQHISILATSLSELSMSLDVIKKIKELKPGTEILVPIGSDSFIPAKLSLTEKVITGLGADVAAERSSDDALEVLEVRRTELENALRQAQEELEKLWDRIEALRPEADRILEKARGAPEAGP